MIKYLVLLFLFFSLEVEGNWQRGITHYSKANYSAQPQIWAMAQDPKTSWLYFANDDGLMEFDGVNWRIYPGEKEEPLRSLKIVDDKIVVGGLHSFGFFQANTLGGWDYVNLSTTFRDFGFVWNVHTLGEQIYVQSDYLLFCIDKHSKLTRIESDHKITASIVFNNRLYLATVGGLFYLNGDRLIAVTDLPDIAKAKIIGMEPCGNELLLVSSQSGLFKFDGHAVRRFASVADSFIKGNQLFCASLRDSILALGSVRDGVFLLNLSDHTGETINLLNGLQNNTVLSCTFDRDGNLWLGLNNGIDCVHLRSPVYQLYGDRSVIGSGAAAYSKEHYLYMGTNQGLYYTKMGKKVENSHAISFMEQTKGQIWSIQEIDNTLFCCGDNGLFEIEREKVHKLEPLSGVWSVVRSADENTAFAGHYDGISLLRKRGGHWVSVGKLSGFYESARNFLVDGPYLWVSMENDGIRRILLSPDLTTAKQSESYLNQADSAYGFCALAKVDGEIIAYNSKGLYRYNVTKNAMEHAADLEKNLAGRTDYQYLYQDQYMNIWHLYNNRSDLSVNKTNQPDGSLSITYTKRNSLVKNRENIWMVDSSQALMALENGFSLLKLSGVHAAAPQPLLQIRSMYVYSKKNTIAFGGKPQKQSIDIPFRKNTFRFEFVATDFSQSSNPLYSYRLTGFNDTWSSYSETSFKEYSSLTEGNYVFEVRAKVDGAEPVYTSMRFTISPPWYRSSWLYLLYAMLLVLASLVTLSRIRKTKEEIIYQKDMELEQQNKTFEEKYQQQNNEMITLQNEKLQVELEYRGQQLTNYAMNIVRKNEMLLDIKKSTLLISRSLTDDVDIKSIRRKILRLINIIDTNIEHDTDYEQFEVGFDAIHHNFLQKLSTRYPQMNKSDRMLCAYIRMDLESKEIAPLLNISLRGVETGRFRIRKKLELERNASLTDFLKSL